MAKVKFPWLFPPLDKWSLVGMNHYTTNGHRQLFVVMMNGNRCIKAEGNDDEYLWSELISQALATTKD